MGLAWPLCLLTFCSTPPHLSVLVTRGHLQHKEPAIALVAAQAGPLPVVASQPPCSEVYCPCVLVQMADSLLWPLCTLPGTSFLLWFP